MKNRREAENIKNKIQFKCKQCGKCCGIGFIYLKRREAAVMAAGLKMPLREFKKKYTTFFLFLGRALKWREDGFCVFMSGNKCSIYDIRPEQCRTWPYWKRITNNNHELKRAQKYCLGIKQSLNKGF